MRKVLRSVLDKPELLNSEEVKNEMERIFRHYGQDDEVRLRRRLEINYRLLNSVEIVQALNTVFEGKCAYCEMPILKHDESVEHHRPLRNAIDYFEDFDSPDHYGWFAYEWSNLILACRECSLNKRNYFPVIGPRAPILSTWEEATQFESGTLLDPCNDSPAKHLTLGIQGIIRPKGRRGANTVKILELNRPHLVERRAERLNSCMELFTQYHRSAEGSESLLVSIRDQLSEFFDSKAPYVGSISNFFRSHFRRISNKEGLNISIGKNELNSYLNILKLLPKNYQIDADPNLDLDSIRILRYMPSEESLPATEVRGSTQVQATTETTNYSRSKKDLARFIRKVEIRNFKGIEELDLDLRGSKNKERWGGSLSLLGENSVGKSSVLQAITLCLIGADKLSMLNLNPDDYLARDPNSWKLLNKVTSVRVYLDFRESVELLIDPLRRKFETSQWPKAIVMSYGARRYFDDNAKLDNQTNSVITLFSPLATISNPIPWINRTSEHEFNSIARAIREVFSLNEDDTILRDDQGSISVKAGGRVAPISKLSEGYKALFAMTVDICRQLLPVWMSLEEANGVVLIDEIETHLHPRWKLKIMTSLRRAFPRVQFIVTTHDPLCLRGMHDGEVQVLFRNEELHIEKIEDLPSVRNLRAEQLLTSDYFGLASTSDSDLEDEIESVALIAAKSESILSSNEKDKLESLEKALGESLVVGNSPSEQIAYEAFDRYILERNKLNSLDRQKLHKETVKKVVDFLHEQIKN